MSDEIDYLLNTSPSGVQIHEAKDGQSILNNVTEWLSTPIGTIWGNPAWGHRFQQFKHQPQSTNTEVAIELSIVGKLPSDVDGVAVDSIDVRFHEVDLVKVSIVINGIDLEVEVGL